MDKYAEFRVSTPLDRSAIPQPIFDSAPKLVDLYWKAWELSWDHVLYREDSPQQRYIDEAFTPGKIWIWDTCFMALYCRYAPKIFPGIESLNNFYSIMHDGAKAPFKVHHPDNPPLFAWVEWEYFKLTGDVDRLRWVVEEHQYLQKHFEFIETAKPRRWYKYAGMFLFAKKTDYGYTWSGVASGMDNTPRGRGRTWTILWLDLLAQQALSAEKISQIAQILELPEVEKEFTAKHDEAAALLNKYYWNETDGFYYDIKKRQPKKQVKVKTPAAFWPLLAGVASEAQAKTLAASVEDPDIFGGIVPWATIARNDKAFEPLGKYWNGGVWLPTAYMGIKALERYGYQDIADRSAETLVRFMQQTYEEYEPATIWEAYCPVAPKPSRAKRNSHDVRPDFCGWSALGPISLFIENILGFHNINAHQNKIEWRLRTEGREGKQGIRNLQFGEIITDLVFDASTKTIEVKSSGSYTLTVNGQSFEIKSGTQSISPTKLV